MTPCINWIKVGDIDKHDITGKDELLVMYHYSPKDYIPLFATYYSKSGAWIINKGEKMFVGREYLITHFAYINSPEK